MNQTLRNYILTHSNTIASMGTLLRFVRRYQGMTQREVAAQLGVSYQQYQKYEYDLYVPQSVMRVKLSEALNLDICFINSLAA